MYHALINKYTNKIENVIKADANYKLNDYYLYSKEITLDEYKIYAQTKIEEKLDTLITSEFTFNLNDTIYKCSYSHFNQKYFADAANACIISQLNNEKLPYYIEITAYDIKNNKYVLHYLTDIDYLKVYAAILEHKLKCRRGFLAKIVSIQTAQDLDTIYNVLNIEKEHKE